MNQTAFTFGALAFAFLVFITIRGDLARWLGVFGLAGGGALAPSPVGPGVGMNTLPGAGLGSALDPGVGAMQASPTGTL